MKNLPETSSQLVLQSREDILAQLSIDSLVLNLQNAADLMFLAYNVLAGTKVWGKVSGLQKSLLDISGNCRNTLDIFGMRAKEVTTTLIKIYGLLLEGKDKLAIIQFKYCRKIAGDMANESQKLSEQIQALCNKSQLVNQEAIEFQVLSHDDKLKMTKLLNEFEGKLAAAKTISECLERDMNKLTTEYVQSVEKLQDGWFVGAMKTVTKSCVKDPKQEALRETHATYNETSQKYNQDRINNLDEIKYYSQQMLKAESGISEAAKAVETFHYAVRALSAIVVTLFDATMFWRSIERYCEQVQSSSFSNAIHDYQVFLSPEERIKEYSSPDFMVIFVRNLSQWVALESVCQEYRKGAKNTYEKVLTNISASPSIDKAKAQTPLLAKQIFDSIDQQTRALKAAMEQDKRWGRYIRIVNARSEGRSSNLKH
ncbi:hypothetical protein OGM63_23510 [Plectonema radiosum NIES-515]|uniref:Uncharacterized protein n=1 Tax=Plectonema radiosum NIES-515 TaxID=2986073 RepID=A0ABT3B6C1_9CYAN|nr:hypothetical protein [Plectonema radiosum NIES-515]